MPHQDPFTHCEALVRAGDKDRFVATLFAPAEHRGPLHALYAFNLEVARIREAVREPLAGEIRLQWWRDVLGGMGRGEVAANPVAAALLATIERFALPREMLETLLEARRFDVYDEPMASMAELERYGEGVSAGLIGLATHILNGGRDAGIDALARHAGLAHAITGLLKAFPVHAARGQLYVPLDVLARHGAGRSDVASGKATAPLRAALAELRRAARGHLAQAGQSVATAPMPVMPALLPVAPVGPTLSRLERSDHDPFVPIEIAPWRRQLLIWRAARRPERMFV
jgi:15-cis-phytoene synthase